MAPGAPLAWIKAETTIPLGSLSSTGPPFPSRPSPDCLPSPPPFPWDSSPPDHGFSVHRPPLLSVPSPLGGGIGLGLQGTGYGGRGKFASNTTSCLCPFRDNCHGGLLPSFLPPPPICQYLPGSAARLSSASPRCVGSLTPLLARRLCPKGGPSEAKALHACPPGNLLTLACW